MEVSTQSIGLHCVLIFTTTITGVQLQEEFWRSRFWVPDSKTVFSPPLLFPGYSVSQRDYSNFIKPTGHQAEVNIDYNEAGKRRGSKTINVLATDSEKEMQNYSESVDGRTHVLLNEQEAYKENEYETRRNRFSNIPWHTELGKSRGGYYESDFGFDTSVHKLNEQNTVGDLSDNGSRKVDNYRSYSTTETSRHQVNDPSRGRHRQLGRQDNDSAINTVRQETIAGKPDRSLHNIRDFERNHFSDFDTSRGRQVWGRYDLGINHFSDVTRQSGFGTERKHENEVQRKLDSERTLHNNTAWHNDSNRSKVTEDYAKENHESRRNHFDFEKWHSDSNMKSKKGGGNYKDGSSNRFTEDTWNSDIGTGSDKLRISGQNEDDGHVQHSHDLIRSPFGDVTWPSVADTIMEEQRTSEGKQDSTNMQPTFDSEGNHFGEENRNDNYGSPIGNRGPEQEEFNPETNRFGDIMWHDGYNPESDHHVPEFNEEYELDSPINPFSGTSWHSDYSLGEERQHIPPYEEADNEPTKNQYTSAAMPFHHGGHTLRTGTRVATGPPTTVTSYMLPNGTKVVRLRRIVLYRKPQMSPQEKGPRSFADIAKGIVQKKVAKFLSLFTIVQFTNEPCQTGDGVNGTCYHHLECRSLGGVASGSCAQGYGVCCYFEKSCGEVTRQNCSYFVNPEFPSPVTNMLACILTIEKAHPDVSQIRLDFFMFQLIGPTNGTCVDDQFIVTGQNTNSIAPIICGINTGQHIYMDVGGTTGPFRLNMLTMGANFPRRFRIKVTQIKKGSPLEAPQNCFQYHRGVQGSIESFNYQMLIGSNLPVRPGYMNNLNYAICIHKEPGYCSVTYTNTAPNGADYPFQLTNVDQDGQPLIPPGQAGAEVFNCPDDYIVINGIRLCGERLNDASVQLDFTRNYPVIDISNGPFIIPVRTNANTNGRGFRIDYQQNTCAS